MRSDGVEPVTLAVLPAGPLWDTSALSLIVWESPRPLFGSGSMFVAAASTCGLEVVKLEFAEALAFVEKGQKALARPGLRAAIPAIAANPSMRN